jgi:cell division cycle protein 37
MISGDKRATDVFVKDVEDTYAHLVQRVAASKEEAGGGEQIQLVPEGADTTISFNVPDGPPPAELALEGEGTEGLDIEEVRKVLQMRWDVFNTFPENLKDALKSNQLEAVNAVLGKMPVPEAEQVVQALDMASILNFAEGGIRDETPAGKAAAAAPSA